MADLNLSDKQKRFCEEYLIDFNATKAAERAGYSVKTARSQGQRMLTKVDIQNYIKSCQLTLQEATGITVKRVLDEYAKIAFFDIREVYDVDGGLMNVRQLDDQSAGAIASIKSYEEFGEDDDGNRIVTGVNKEVRTYDKVKALDALGKHLGIFLKDNNQKKADEPKQVIIINGKEVEF